MCRRECLAGEKCPDKAKCRAAMKKAARERVRYLAERAKPKGVKTA